MVTSCVPSSPDWSGARTVTTCWAGVGWGDAEELAAVVAPEAAGLGAGGGAEALPMAAGTAGDGEVPAPPESGAAKEPDEAEVVVVAPGGPPL
jgi:hypothetical protein